MILEQNQTRPPAGDIEAAQHFDFVALHVDREEIEAHRRAGFLKHAVERPDRHRDDGFGRGARRHALAVERRQRAGYMQRQRASGIVGRGTGDREDHGRTHGAQLVGKIGLRLDQHAGPAGLLQMPGLRALARIVGADLDEEPFNVAEERRDQPHLVIGRNARQEDAFHRNQRTFGARVRSTMALVEWPGTRSIRITSPPCASTMAWPTTSSRL